jgi:hypothetical protein
VTDDGPAFVGERAVVIRLDQAESQAFVENVRRKIMGGARAMRERTQEAIAKLEEGEG